ncbi:hypothetical protein [Mesorhizobium sp. A623]
MRSLRLAIACVILLGAGFIAHVIAGPDLADRPSMRPVDRMLLGSIVSLGICTLWIWISARAGR